MDILFAGSGSYIVYPDYMPCIYRNDGGSFTDINADFPECYGNFVTWGDYDGDGDLDVLHTGSYSQYPNMSPFAEILQNDSGTFTRVDVGLLGLWCGACAWGDCDNDGDLGLLQTGEGYGSDQTTDIYRNDDSLSTNAGADLLPVYQGDVSWGDYDNDGDLDILLNGGETHNDQVSYIYRNDGNSPNTMPASPTSLASEILTDRVILRWEPGYDTETPRSNLICGMRKTGGGGGDRTR